MVGRNPQPVKHLSKHAASADFDDQIAAMVTALGLPRAALSFVDFADGRCHHYRADEWFHAASTIKVAIMVALFALEEDGEVGMNSAIRVTNDFHSVVEGAPFRLDPEQDSCPELYRWLGREVAVDALVRDMIVSSSNLATNLLLASTGVSVLQQKLVELGFDGMELRRGVEDEAAFQQGIINRVTARGLLQLFTHIWQGEWPGARYRQGMLEILFEQRFSDRIPSGIPEDIRAHTRFAHKTGEISTVVHDAGLIFLPERMPYGLVVLTETGGSPENSRQLIRALSHLVYRQRLKP